MYAVPSVTVIVVAPAAEPAVRTDFVAPAPDVPAARVGYQILIAFTTLAHSLKAREIIFTRFAPYAVLEPNNVVASETELTLVEVLIVPFSDVPITPMTTCPLFPPEREDAVSVNMTFGTRFEDINIKRLYCKFRMV